VSEGVKHAAGAVGMPLPGFDPVMKALSLKFNQPDLDLYHRAEETLTNMFLEDLQASARRTPRIVLLINKYEDLTAINEWAGRFASQLPRHAALVIAGQITPNSPGYSWNAVWSGWRADVAFEELKPLSDGDARELMLRYFQAVHRREPDPAQVEKVVAFAGGLPLVVTTAVRLAAEGETFDFDEQRKDVVRHLVNDVIMKKAPEPLRTLLEATAALRYFNKESLAAVTGAKIEAAVYRDLEVNDSYIRSGKKGPQIHAQIRDVINEYVRDSAPDRWRDLHARAAAYYAERLPRANEQQRQEMSAELIYHRYHLSPDEGRSELCEVLNAAYGRRQYPFCREIVNDARTYVRDDEATLDWLSFYDASLGLGMTDPGPRPAQTIEALLEKRSLSRELRASALERLATMIWFEKLREASGVERAEKLYEEALQLRSFELNDRPGQARLLIWIGILRQRTGGSGEETLREALEIAQELHLEMMAAFAQRELSIALRMHGRFAEALPLIEASVKTFDALKLYSDCAHSVLNQGALLASIGRLADAEKCLKESQKLFERAGASSAERAWLLHGFGDVELRRGNYAKARELYAEAAKQWGDEDKFGSAVGEGALASLALAARDFEEAVEHADRALALAGTTDDTFGYAWSLKTKGLALMALGRRGEAGPILAEAAGVLNDYGAAHARCLLLAEMDDAAAETEVEDCASRNGYADVMARITLRRGMRDRNAQVLVDALLHALHFNTFVLDSVVREIAADGTLAAQVHELWRARDLAGQEQALAAREGVKSRKTVEQVLTGALDRNSSPR
jgi:tetratricopeptide (TPR) repeat protein